MKQSTNRVLMVEPYQFFANEQTAIDNAYQNLDAASSMTSEKIQEQALAEFNSLVEVLRNEGITVEVLKDTPQPATPDSIFPNNWFSTRHGLLIIYPMHAENRQAEISKFRDQVEEIYNPEEIFDMSSYHDQGRSLEGTGAIVFDHEEKIAYAVLSKRSDEELLDELCQKIGYTALPFRAYQSGGDVYHTNILMGIGTDVAFLGTELIDEQDRSKVRDSLAKKHVVIDLSPEQVIAGAGNAIELEGKNGRFIAMSQGAYDSLTPEQIKQVEEKLPIRTAAIPTIETLGGGSVRCMIAEIY